MTLAVGANPRIKAHRIMRRGATPEGPLCQGCFQPSLRDGCPWSLALPWVETHGYFHRLAPRDRKERDRVAS